MKRSRLPLTALRSFEVAGRLQSFTLAAEELSISQAAVSRQVRELEILLGKPLFERGHRSVSLTRSGEQMLSTLTPAFDEIGASVDRLRQDKAARTVIVSTEPSFASAWLVRNLSSFREEAPDIDLVLDADPRLVEFRAAKATLAIRHSADRSDWPRVEIRHLVDVKMIPVAAPHLLDKIPSINHPSELLQLPLLHEESRSVWQAWFAAAGVVTPVQRGTVFTDGGLVLQAALQGEGVALIDAFFVQDDLQANRLCQPFQLSIPHGAYWLVAKRFTDLSRDAVGFMRWLEAKLRSG